MRSAVVLLTGLVLLVSTPAVAYTVSPEARFETIERRLTEVEQRVTTLEQGAQAVARNQTKAAVADDLILEALSANATLLGIFTALLGLALANYQSRTERPPNLRRRVIVEGVALLVLILYNSVAAVVAIYSYNNPWLRSCALTLLYLLFVLVFLAGLILTIYVIRE
jgi:hypothetical protein